MKSIRRNLVLRLVGGLVVGSLAVLAGTYALTRQQIGSLFDDELRQVALADLIWSGIQRGVRPYSRLSLAIFLSTIAR